MRLFLIRHGETLDNVAGVYAGSRDSALTAHGVIQARRLANHLAALAPTIGPIRHIFSSDLQRAANTAQAIVDAHVPKMAVAAEGATAPVGVERLKLVKLPELRERDFGAAEGKSFSTPHPDAESQDAMAARVGRFIQGHLVPVLDNHIGHRGEISIVVVAHGIILNVLLRVLLSTFAPVELERLQRGAKRPPYLVSWGNTGYVEASLSARSTDPASLPPQLKPVKPAIKLTVTRVNVTDHLRDLKRTRGGIGSAKFDSKQRTMDSFMRRAVPPVTPTSSEAAPAAPAAKKRKLEK
ncbi:phosphoglycerate mutase [Diplogelasinospora grovesii]|uniref:Phosphoglycerate mutase n=1 Tax=Diplogelasinospora grovesii TaxID=303347 RepID=A0AAN6N573_9PEZI|nr:phosphoglycerate mutase [Diplogelasinospora grovesii]